MAVAIASSNTNTASGSSVVVTKPTGLAVGDLMIAGVYHYWTGSDRQINTPSGWTLISTDRVHNGGENTGTGMSVFYKIAASGDVAASDFTFDQNGASSEMGACVLRITGMSPSAPINASSSNPTDNGGSGGSYSWTGITPTFADCMLLIFAATRQASSHETYAIATSNPSWTELFEIQSNEFSLAYAIRPEITATGDASFAITGSSGSTDAIGCIVAIKPSIDVTLSPSVINATGAVPTPTISGGATVSVSTVNATGAVLTPSDAGQADWSAQGKSSSGTWNSQTKS